MHSNTPLIKWEKWEKMSQNIIVKLVSPQNLLSINMRGIDQLFPGFAMGDFALLYGSQAVLSLSDDPARLARMSAAARKRACSLFSWKEAASQVEEIYLESVSLREKL